MALLLGGGKAVGWANTLPLIPTGVLLLMMVSFIHSSKLSGYLSRAADPPVVGKTWSAHLRQLILERSNHGQTVLLM